MHLTYAKMLAIVGHENMKLGDNTLNNERLSLVNTKLLTKYYRIQALILLIITNFHLYLIQLWCQFFQIFAYGDVVYAQTWEVLTLKNYIEPP